MPRPAVSLQSFIDGILRKHEKSRNQFVNTYKPMYGHSRSTWFRWLSGESRVEEAPSVLVDALAHLERTTPAHIYLQMGRDINESPVKSVQVETDYETLRYYPLVNEVGDNVPLKNGIRFAIRARYLSTHDGSFHDVLAAYERALAFAEDAKADRLVTYIKTFLSNTYQILGMYPQARRTHEQARRKADQYEHDGRQSGDWELQGLGERLKGIADSRSIWSYWWAGGVSVTSEKAGLELVEMLRKAHVYHRLPQTFVFLARCALALDKREDAIGYINQAEEWASRLSKDRYSKYNLFLDGAITLDGRLDNVWQEDQVAVCKTDVLIAVRRAEEAFEVYKQNKKHRRVGVHLDYHNWANPQWQDVLHRQTLLTEENDARLAYSIDDWTNELADIGDKRVLTLNILAQGDYFVANGNFSEAHRRFTQAKVLAEKESPDFDLVLRGTIGASRAAVRVNDKPLAIELLTMVERVSHQIDNPYLVKQYELTRREIHQS